MKINRSDKRLKNTNIAKANKSVPVVKQGHTGSFEQDLTQNRILDINQRMNEVLAQIDQLKNRMQQRLTIDLLMQYCKMVKLFLGEATAKAYLLRQERSGARRGRVLLISVDMVDKEIGGLLEEFISKDKSELDILRSIDKIRGMLVDLMI